MSTAVQLLTLNLHKMMGTIRSITQEISHSHLMFRSFEFYMQLQFIGNALCLLATQRYTVPYAPPAHVPVPSRWNLNRCERGLATIILFLSQSLSKWPGQDDFFFPVDPFAIPVVIKDMWWMLVYHHSNTNHMYQSSNFWPKDPRFCDDSWHIITLPPIPCTPQQDKLAFITPS